MAEKEAPTQDDRSPLDRAVAKLSWNEGGDLTKEECAAVLGQLVALGRELERTKRRYQWAANELLACDYGDNPKEGEHVGWVVYGWRDPARKPHGERRRIYGPSIDIAIDGELP